MSEYHAYTVRVIGVSTHEDESGPYTGYVLRVDSSKSETWIVERRYHEFRDLHNKLIKEHKKLKTDLPPLPPKKIFGKMSQDVIDERKRRLVDYLNMLLIHVKPTHCETLNEFLCREKQDLEEWEKSVAAGQSSSGATVTSLPE
jgi:hypothetical protein